ncbi:MAG: hypothetical protein GY758_13520 [Fuerstiella sp.]|nr:hypothetical protein [Fuerstiella sp.]
MSFFFSLLAYMARSGWEISHVIMWGRYRYLPTLFWCVVLCGVLDRIADWMTAERKKAIPLVAAAGLLLFVLSQHRIACEAATVFRQIVTRQKQKPESDQKTQPSVRNIKSDLAVQHPLTKSGPLPQDTGE